MQSVSRVDDDPPDMEDPGPNTRICGYVCTSMWFLLACMFMPIFYKNNAWLTIREETNTLEFQRGLNDDCIRNKSTNAMKCAPWYSEGAFPPPFDSIVDPPPILYVCLYIARFLLVVPFACLLFSIACCCNEKCEKLAKDKSKLFIHLLLAIGALFVLLFVLLLVTLLFVSAILRYTPPRYDESLGLGLYGFAIGGGVFYMAGVYCLYHEEFNTVIDRRFPFLGQIHLPLETEAPPVSMRSLQTV